MEEAPTNEGLMGPELKLTPRDTASVLLLDAREFEFVPPNMAQSGGTFGKTVVNGRVTPANRRLRQDNRTYHIAWPGNAEEEEEEKVSKVFK